MVWVASISGNLGGPDSTSSEVPSSACLGTSDVLSGGECQHCLSTRVDFGRPPGAAGGSSRVRGATAATEQCGDWWASRGDYSWAEKGNTPA